MPWLTRFTDNVVTQVHAAMATDSPCRPPLSITKSSPTLEATDALKDSCVVFDEYHEEYDTNASAMAAGAGDLTSLFHCPELAGNVTMPGLLRTWYTCLGLLLVAVSLHCVCGAGEMGSNCTSSSDCDYDHGKCRKPDQCEIGLCVCASGYKMDSIESGVFCRKLKKIGDRCDVIYDKCYDGTCKGMCACPMGLHASDDEKSCVGNMYGEACRLQAFSNSQWNYASCETRKGLKCDSTTYKCVCVKGLKRVGDHCEYYKNGESCDAEKTCDRHLRCQSSSKCGCSTGMKEFTSKMWDDGVEETRQMCIHDKATTNIAQMGECNTNFYDTSAKICGDYLYCSACPDWANEWQNNTKCISGAAELSTNKMALAGLMVLSLVAQLH
ncbi:hypothetical protein LSAT2_023231 [Lamellibrachia satsuma]|nr:hypothetical protein LSAT2_023231 [Lamellibrachia satsuma]